MRTATAPHHTTTIPVHVQAVVAALDGRRIGTPEQGWTAYVLGIHTDHQGVWVQVARDHDPLATMVLRLSCHATAAQTIAALEHCEQACGAYPHVIDVMQRV